MWLSNIKWIWLTKSFNKTTQTTLVVFLIFQIFLISSFKQIGKQRMFLPFTLDKNSLSRLASRKLIDANINPCLFWIFHRAFKAGFHLDNFFYRIRPSPFLSLYMSKKLYWFDFLQNHPFCVFFTKKWTKRTVIVAPIK